MVNVTVTHEPGSEDDERFVARAGAEELGFMTIRRVHGEGIIARHTEVHAIAKGRGVGEALFSHLVRTARDEQLYVVPACSIVLSRFEKHLDTSDVRATSRARLDRPSVEG
jgi:predicted GNAT family acetyltransferase